jgi:arylsulfatase A-like enzyme
MASRSSILLASLVLLFAGCSEARTDAEQPNVLLISIDTLRADHLSCYGYERETSPNLDAYASRAVRYEDAMAPAPWTLPSHVAMLTGRHPRDVGIKDSRSKVPRNVPLLAELLAKQGYRTQALIDSPKNGFLGAGRGFDRGFSEYRHPSRPKGRATYDMATTVDAAIGWLNRRKGNRPFFLFLHTKSVHSAAANDPEVTTPYVKPARYQSRFLPGGKSSFKWRTKGGESGSPWLNDWNKRIAKDGPPGPKAFPAERIEELVAMYDAGIVYVDEHLQRLLERLEELGLDERTIVVITSDHGEAFMEHRFLAHIEVYDSQLHVPLILHDPADPGGRVVSTPVRLEDIVPTLLDRVGVPIPPGISGRTLPRSDSEAREPRTRYAYARVHEKPIYDAASIEEGAWKLVRHRASNEGEFSTELYAIEQDPDEERPVRAAQIAEGLERKLVEWLNRPVESGERVELGERDVAALQALGYAEGGDRAEPAWDPLSELDELRYLRAVERAAGSSLTRPVSPGAVLLQLELLGLEELPDVPDLRRSLDGLVEEELLTKSRQNYYLTELGADRVVSAREDGEIE